MDTGIGSTGTIRVSLALLSIGCVFAVILLMPTLPTTLLSVPALLAVPFALIRNSRKAALSVDLFLFSMLIASHLPPFAPRTPAGPLDIVSLILILSFHEFSSISSDLNRLKINYTQAESYEVGPSSMVNVCGALLYRSLSTAGIFLLASIISEAYFLAARGISASLYSIYGVAVGLMAVIAFLFFLLTVSSRKPAN